MIIAHRGASGYAPENTLSAFAAALEMGARGAEFDVQLTADAQPVVFHDRTTRRMSGAGRRVCGLTLAEIQTIDVGSWFNRRHKRRARPEYAGLRVPTLREVFRALEGRTCTLFVELKHPRHRADALGEAVSEAVSDFGRYEDTIILSFNHHALERLRILDSTIKIAPLFARRLSRPAASAGHIAGVAKNLGACGVALEQLLTTRRRTEALRAAGLAVFVWTVNTRAGMRRFLRMGVDGIMTNYPDVLCHIRDETFGRD